MQRTRSFRNLAELQAEKARVKAVVAGHEKALSGHWALVRDPGYRREMASRGVGELIGSWDPLSTISNMIRSDHGVLTGMIVSLIKPRSRSFKGRILAFAVGIIAPILIRKFAITENLEHLAVEVRKIWDRFRDDEEVAEEEEPTSAAAE